MTSEAAIANLRLWKFHEEANHFSALIRSHEKERSAAIACLRQMDKVNAENARLRKQLKTKSHDK